MMTELTLALFLVYVLASLLNTMYYACFFVANEAV